MVGLAPPSGFLLPVSALGLSMDSSLTHLYHFGASQGNYFLLLRIKDTHCAGTVLQGIMLADEKDRLLSCVLEGADPQPRHRYELPVGIEE